MTAKTGLRIAAGMAAVSLFIAGCGGGGSDEPASLVGTWTWQDLVVNGVTVNPGDLDGATAGGSTSITPAWLAQAANEPGGTITVTVTFSNGGTVTGTITAVAPGQAPESQSLPGTWLVSGNTLTLSFVLGGTTFAASGTYSASDSELTVNMSNAQVLAVLNANAALMSGLTAEDQALLRGLSASMSFSR